MARFRGQPLPSLGLDTVLHADFEALRAARRALDDEISGFFATATQDWLNEPTTITSVIYKTTFTNPRWFFVLHSFNHQTHHRGQVTTLMKQLGVDPGVTDLPAMNLS